MIAPSAFEAPVRPFYRLVARDERCAARAGVIATPHGDIPTPAFAPVGTNATVKGISPRELCELGTRLILSNTYHLSLRPGEDVVAEMGGLHRFMGWDGPILTDSGGFQVFSLGHLRRISTDGVTFRSHIDGSERVFTPESVLDIEARLGSDIAMVLDECRAYGDTRDQHEEAVMRTTAWAERARRHRAPSTQAVFGIVQGGAYEDLRRQSVSELVPLDFDGYAIGGLSVGEPKELMHRVLEATVPLLPESKPRYIMGVGSPEDLFECIERGIDMMDCVLPTRLGRNGALFTRYGRMNIRNAQYALDGRPPVEGCGCRLCCNFSRAYLHHLFRCEELLGLRLASLHNLRFLLDIAATIRSAIIDGTFAELKADFLASYRPVDEDVQARNRAAWVRHHEARRTAGITEADG